MEAMHARTQNGGVSCFLWRPCEISPIANKERGICCDLDSKHLPPEPPFVPLASSAACAYISITSCQHTAATPPSTSPYFPIILFLGCTSSARVFQATVTTFRPHRPQSFLCTAACILTCPCIVAAVPVTPFLLLADASPLPSPSFLFFWPGRCLLFTFHTRRTTNPSRHLWPQRPPWRSFLSSTRSCPGA